MSEFGHMFETRRPSAIDGSCYCSCRQPAVTVLEIMYRHGDIPPSSSYSVPLCNRCLLCLTTTLNGAVAEQYDAYSVQVVDKGSSPSGLVLVDEEDLRCLKCDGHTFYLKGGSDEADGD